MKLNSVNSRLRVPLGAAMLLALFTALPARADYPSTVLDQAPAGYWRLNETTQPPPNNFAANQGSLGASAQGTYVNSPTRGLTGPFSGSLAVGLDGTSQYVTTPYQAGLNTTNFSVELWLNPAQVPYPGAVAYVASSFHASTAAPGRSGWYMAQDNGQTFGHGSAFIFRMFNQPGATITDPSVDLWAPISVASVWYHIVITYDLSSNTATFYTNGVVAMSAQPAGWVPNPDGTTTFGVRSPSSFPWPGLQAECAMYSSALSQARIAAHYTAATTAPSTYVTTVQADSPVLYYRFGESNEPATANIGSLGSAANGLFQAGIAPGGAGPRPAAYTGFEAGNNSVSVPGTGPSVRVPPLNFNTDALTISAWIKPSTSAQNPSAGIIVCDAGNTYAGLTMDFNGGLNLGYVWNNDPASYNWSPTVDNGLPSLPASDWAYVALVVRPDQAWIYLCASNNPAGFAGATNFLAHVEQPFDAATLFGSDSGVASYSFAGNIDEVAMFNRALTVGDLYTQYGSAVGGLQPRMFSDLQGPTDPVAAGDPIVLSADVGGTPPLTFIWRANGTPIATSSSNTLVIGTSTLANTANYDVVVTNAHGNLTSSPVSVTVVTPSIPALVQILGYQSRTLYPTGMLSMTVVATGGGLKYQWYKNATPIPTGTSASYTVAHVVPADAGNYSVFVTNALGTLTSGPPVTITIPSVTAGSYEAAIVDSAPESWWRLDESPGSTNMFDGMGHHDGTYTNANGTGPLPTLGATGALVDNPNTAATFAASGQGLGVVPYSPDLNAPQYTIEAWVNTSVADGQVPVSTSYGTGGSWIQSSGGWWYGDCSQGLFGNNEFINTEAAIIPGQWSHVVINYDVNQLGSDGNYYPFTFYVNGETDGYIWGAPPANTGGPFIIGARGVSAATLADRFFDGKVDEVAVYKRNLTDPEILDHYAARGIVLIPVTFTTPLLSQTLTTGKSFSFSTAVQGTPPISLQWYKDGALIAGATTTTYAITNTSFGDAGTYTLWATNSGATNSLSATVTVYSPFGYANVTNNLVLHLRFEGDTTDSSGRANNGTPSSATAPAFIPGIIGSQALQYTTDTVNGQSGSNVTSASYVTFGSVGSGPPTDLRFGATTSFSVSLWLQLTNGAVPGDLPFISIQTNSMNNPGWGMAPAYQTGGWQWDLNDGVNNIDVNGANNSINDGKWHNFVLTVDRTAKVADSYLDGVHTSTRNIASLGSIDNNNYWPMAIGQDPTGLYKEPGSATVDDIGIWRQALTALEVTQIASAGSTSGRSFDTVAPPSATVTITYAGGNVVLNYAAGTLLQSTNVALPMNQWTPVPGASPPSFMVPATGAGNYYRVLAP